MRTITGGILVGFNGKVKQAVQGKILPHKKVMKKYRKGEPG
jgi:hypothetical protein